MLNSNTNDDDSRARTHAGRSLLGTAEAATGRHRPALALALSSSLMLVACSRSYDGEGGDTESMGDTIADTAGTGGATETGGSGNDGDGSTESAGDMEESAGDTDSGSDGGSCGNDLIDPGEDCDGDNLGGQSCEDFEQLGFTGGTLACAANCTFDTADCTACGDGTVEGDEECDGRNFGGVNCQNFGLGLGLPLCTEECAFDTSVCPPADEGKSCMNGNDNICGDGLFCVSSQCYDGSLGDPCLDRDDCQDDLNCVDFFCS